ncbi:MAG: hypothetical protein K0R84_1993 [Clostridia bacterium]|nr:hypothetical protein [Clostridia bacterium]
MRDKFRLILFVLIAVLVFSFNSEVSAEEERSYYIDVFQVTVRITENGDLEVSEEITYVFDGAFNGIYRTIDPTGSEGIEEIRVATVEGRRQLQLIHGEGKHDNNNTFVVLKDENKHKIVAMSKSADERKTFIISYLVKRPVMKYNDISELYWKFMGTETDVKINRFEVVIELPSGVEKTDIRSFAHGPLSGNVTINNNSSVVLSVDALRPHNMVEARILFPAEALNKLAKYRDENALNRILAEEEQRSEEANRKRTAVRIFISLAFLLAFIELLMIAFIYFRYDKEHKSSFQDRYLRELPYSYSPAVMAVLWNFGKVTPKEITATLLDLVRRKLLELKANDLDEYIFIKTKTYNKVELSEHEIFLINWLVDEIGDGSKISINQLKEYTKETKNAQSFKAKYDAWVELIKQEADSMQFFDNNSRAGVLLGVITGLIGLVFGAVTLILHENIPGFLILLFASLILMLYSVFVKRRSQIGAEHFSRWKAFKRYLVDFNSLEKAELSQIKLWEHYLVYAISLGVAKEAIKQLKVRFKDEDFRNRDLTFMYYGYFGYYGLGMRHLDLIDHITADLIKTTESTYTQAISQLSSGGGSGGGFSGGAGGGGGGGGAGAF